MRGEERGGEERGGKERGEREGEMKSRNANHLYVTATASQQRFISELK